MHLIAVSLHDALRGPELERATLALWNGGFHLHLPKEVAARAAGCVVEVGEVTTEQVDLFDLWWQTDPAFRKACVAKSIGAADTVLDRVMVSPDRDVYSGMYDTAFLVLPRGGALAVEDPSAHLCVHASHPDGTAATLTMIRVKEGGYLPHRLFLQPKTAPLPSADDLHELALQAFPCDLSYFEKHVRAHEVSSSPQSVTYGLICKRVLFPKV